MVNIFTKVKPKYYPPNPKPKPTITDVCRAISRVMRVVEVVLGISWGMRLEIRYDYRREDN
eukprot:1324230-Amorphochlora_amoeboformis.AAC.1